MYSASRWFKNTPFPSSDTKTQSNTRIDMSHHLRQHLILHDILQPNPSLQRSSFVKLAIRVILCVFLFAQYVKTTLFRSSEGLFK